MTPPNLTPDFSSWKEALEQSLRILEESHRRGLSEIPPVVLSEPEKDKWLRDIPETGRGVSAALDDVYRKTLEDNADSHVGNHFAYIPSGSTHWAAIGDLIASFTNRYTGSYLGARGGVTIHNDLIRWLCEVFGFPASAYGVFQSGGSMANFACIHVAREVHGIEVPSEHAIYMTADAHSCIPKALKMAGLKSVNIRLIPMDARRRMNAESLEQQVQDDLKSGVKPWLIVASAGTTNTGAIDPFPQLADIAEAHGLWLHVDGAYGGLYQLTEEAQKKLKGIERAHSIVVDPHKSLCMPFGLGVYLVRDRRYLFETFCERPDFFMEEHMQGSVAPMDHSPELSRPFRSLKLWFTLQVLGLSPFRAHLTEKLRLAQKAHRRLTELGYEMLEAEGPQLTISAFRWKTDESSKKILDTINENQQIFISSTLLDGKYYIRFCVNNHLSDEKQLDKALIEFEKARPNQ